MARPAGSVSRRDFARLFAVGGSAALFSHPAWAQSTPAALPAGGAGAGEPFWTAVRAQFVMPPDLAVMNAANLCPASGPVLRALTRETEDVDRNPSPQNRARLSGAQGRHAQGAGRLSARDAGRDRHHAQHQRIEQPRVQRPGPQGRRRGRASSATTTRATTRRGRKRRSASGSRVSVVEQKNPHPGAEYYIDAFTQGDDATHQGPRLHALHQHRRRPVPGQGDLRGRARARRDDAARRRADVRARSTSICATSIPTSTPGSAHKWPCGARECGVLFVNSACPRSHLALVLQRLPGRGRHLAPDGGVRPARRGDDDRVCRGAGVSDEGWPSRRSSSARKRWRSSCWPGLRKIDGFKQLHVDRSRRATAPS